MEVITCFTLGIFPSHEAIYIYILTTCEYPETMTLVTIRIEPLELFKMLDILAFFRDRENDLEPIVALGVEHHNNRYKFRH